MPTPLYSRIFEEINRLPSGKVASYGQIAQAAGLFRGARLVGWALGTLPPDTLVPWQRVINQRGFISIANPHFSQAAQAELLRQEGVEVIQQDGLFVLPSPPWYFAPPLK